MKLPELALLVRCEGGYSGLFRISVYVQGKIFKIDFDLVWILTHHLMD